MKSIIDVLDLSVEELDEIINVAEDIIARPEAYAESCHGKKLATLFFEPSTRTRLSFEAAMYELGGHVLSVTGAGASSVAKGESISDTAKTVSNYADIIAMRHPMEGAAYVAAGVATIPVINAGDGGHCHPTQTLADLLTIHREKGGFSGLTIGLCGDLKYGRTVHSLINAMSRYDSNKFVLISPAELKIPSYVKNVLKEGNIPYEQTESLEEAMPQLDILYMTRIQRERFTDEAEYERLKDSYILTPEKLTAAKKDLIVMHPLPRVNEISVAVDDDERACYFKQVLNGKYMRMALILKLLGLVGEKAEAAGAGAGVAGAEVSGVAGEAGETTKAGVAGEATLTREFICHNPRCITSCEQELPQIFKLADPKNKIYRCIYCEAKAR